MNEKGHIVPKSEETVELAGPREKIYFNPAHVHAAICTCGGICPGLNNVIRAIVRCLWYRYGVRRITGIKYGYQGLLPTSLEAPVALDRKAEQSSAAPAEAESALPTSWTPLSA